MKLKRILRQGTVLHKRVYTIRFHLSEIKNRKNLTLEEKGQGSGFFLVGIGINWERK
jgi:hypothetical protein